MYQSKGNYATPWCFCTKPGIGGGSIACWLEIREIREQLRDFVCAGWHPCLWEIAKGKEGKLWRAAETNQSQLQVIWEVWQTGCLVTIRLFSAQLFNKVVSISNVPLKDAQCAHGWSGNAIRWVKNPILGHSRRLRDAGQAATKSGVDRGDMFFSFFRLDRGDMWTASHPTPGLSSRRQSELKTRSGQRNGPKIGSTFQNNFFLTICTNHGKICGLLCCNGRYQLLREILYYQYLFVKYCGKFHCFISSS